MESLDHLINYIRRLFSVLLFNHLAFVSLVPHPPPAPQAHPWYIFFDTVHMWCFYVQKKKEKKSLSKAKRAIIEIAAIRNV